MYDYIDVARDALVPIRPRYGQPSTEIVMNATSLSKTLKKIAGASVVVATALSALPAPAYAGCTAKAGCSATKGCCGAKKKGCCAAKKGCCAAKKGCCAAKKKGCCAAKK